MRAEGVRVEIDRLVLRVPGLDRDQAARLGREVAEQLAAMAPDRDLRARRVGSVALKLELERDAPRESLARHLAGRIVDALG